jgi:hypothetical protein
MHTHIYLPIILCCFLLNPSAKAADFPSHATAMQYIPKAVELSLEKNQIPAESMYFSGGD